MVIIRRMEIIKINIHEATLIQYIRGHHSILLSSANRSMFDLDSLITHFKLSKLQAKS